MGLHQVGMAPAFGDLPALQHDYLVELIEPVAVMGDDHPPGVMAGRAGLA